MSVRAQEPEGDRTHVGCHFMPRGQHVQAVLTQAQRDQIQETIARSDTFDILHYDIALDITRVEAKVIHAATTVTFSPLLADQDRIRFDLLGLTVDSVKADGGTLPHTYDGSYLTVQFPEVLPVGEVQELTVYYHGEPVRDPQWGGFYFEGGYIYNLGIGLSSIPPNFGKVWYPCFDSFVERATYTYHVRSAGGYRAHCQGDLIGETQLDGDTIVRSFHLAMEIPTHVSAIAAGNYVDHDGVHQGAYGAVPYRLTAKPDQIDQMVVKFQHLGDAIDVCEFWYGQYTWGRVGYVHTTVGALEIPGNVAYPQHMNGQTDKANRGLFTHELGHHWWGDMVTPYIHNDMWVKEGPAEYSGHLLEEWIGGAAALEQTVLENQYDVLRNAHRDDDDYRALSPMPDPYIYGTHTYYKGASVMHNLRGYLGDTLFRVAMRGVQEQQANTALSAAGFRDALEAATGADLHPFFQDQVFTPGFSVFVHGASTVVPEGGQWRVEMDVVQRLRGTDQYHTAVPLEITCISAEQDTSIHRVMVGGASTSVSFLAPFEPAMVVLNRHSRLNQARMHHEATLVPGSNFPTMQLRTEFNLFQTQLVDSTLNRIEHIWAGPEASQLGDNVATISSTHYWRVDGLWPEGTILRGRVAYVGTHPYQFDHDLYGVTELNAIMLYRERPEDPWTIYPDQTVSLNSLTNGLGFITLDVLRKGEYAFGKSIVPVGMGSLHAADAAIALHPVPTAGPLTVATGKGPVQRAQAEVRSADGRLVMEQAMQWGGGATATLDVSALPSGAYVLSVRNTAGERLGSGRFQVQH